MTIPEDEAFTHDTCPHCSLPVECERLHNGVAMVNHFVHCGSGHYGNPWLTPSQARNVSEIVQRLGSVIVALRDVLYDKADTYGDATNSEAHVKRQREAQLRAINTLKDAGWWPKKPVGFIDSRIRAAKEKE